MSVKVKSKVIPTSFLKIEGTETLVEAIHQRKRGRLVELVGDQSPGSEALSRSRIERERRRQRRC